jgi:hypothetical protein
MSDPERHRLRSVRIDCLFLTGLIGLSCSPYITGLGFYSDDWAFLKSFSQFSRHVILKSMLSHVHLRHHVEVFRPGQILYMSILYKLFGLEPLGYHVVNTTVLAVASVLFYLALRQLGGARVIALSVGLVFSVLPHFCATRFWYAAFQVNLSLALYFLSFYSDLRMLQASHSGFWLWKLLGWMSLLGSVLCYETVLPLFLLNPILVWSRRHKCESASETLQSQSRTRLPRPYLTPMRLGLLLGSNLLLLIPVVIVKVLYSSRLPRHLSIAQHLQGFTHLLKQALIVSYGVYGIELPKVLLRIEHNYGNLTVALLAIILGLAVFIFLRRRFVCAKAAATPGEANQCSDAFLARRAMLCLIGIGVLVFVLGYAIFLTNEFPKTSATGIRNRINSAAAIGIALSFVGFVGLFSACFKNDALQRNLFCGLIALLSASNVIINATIGSFWVRAYRQEQTVLQVIYKTFPQLAPSSIVLLDGVCPYDGPAIVFESSWDLRGALGRHYHDLTIEANVVTSKLQVETDGISIFLYNRRAKYPYGKEMFVYRFDQGSTYPLPNAEAAHEYFETIRPAFENRCPPGEEGSGSPIF